MRISSLSTAGKTVSPVPKIHLEKRAGKIVTVIKGMHTYGLDRLNEIAGRLKSSLGSGGTVKNGAIEIQGDKRPEVARILTEAGFRPVFAGG